MTALRTGDRVRTLGFPAVNGFGSVAPETGTILADTVQGLPGFVRIQFDGDHGALLVAASRLTGTTLRNLP